MKVFITAGEPSGDRLGAALHRRDDRGVVLRRRGPGPVALGEELEFRSADIHGDGLALGEGITAGERHLALDLVAGPEEDHKQDLPTVDRDLAPVAGVHALLVGRHRPAFARIRALEDRPVGHGINAIVARAVLRGRRTDARDHTQREPEHKPEHEPQRVAVGEPERESVHVAIAIVIETVHEIVGTGVNETGIRTIIEFRVTTIATASSPSIGVVITVIIHKAITIFVDIVGYAAFGGGNYLPHTRGPPGTAANLTPACTSTHP